MRSGDSCDPIRASRDNESPGLMSASQVVKKEGEDEGSRRPSPGCTGHCLLMYLTCTCYPELLSKGAASHAVKRAGESWPRVPNSDRESEPPLTLFLEGQEVEALPRSSCDLQT